VIRSIKDTPYGDDFTLFFQDTAFDLSNFLVLNDNTKKIELVFDDERTMEENDTISQWSVTLIQRQDSSIPELKSHLQSLDKSAISQAFSNLFKREVMSIDGKKFKVSVYLTYSLAEDEMMIKAERVGVKEEPLSLSVTSHHLGTLPMKELNNLVWAYLKRLTLRMTVDGQERLELLEESISTARLILKDIVEGPNEQLLFVSVHLQDTNTLMFSIQEESSKLVWNLSKKIPSKLKMSLEEYSSELLKVILKEERPKEKRESHKM
jgi:hypothetical protein